MKHIAFLLFFVNLTSALKAQTGKFGALAIDKSNGWYYGWAYDHNTQSEADARALKECKDRGGNCHIVKRFGAGWCAVYRTIDGNNVGDAYGWGVARTKTEAEIIANNECLKRSHGVPCNNHVWACNSRLPKEEKDKVKEEKKPKTEDDFWSKDQTGNNDNNSGNTGFWDGKGSDAEEKHFESQTKPPQSNQFIGDIESYGTKYLTVKCIDHGTADGDRVSVKLNGELIKSDITLTGYYTTFEIKLKSGQNRIDFTALNEGSMSPNTAKFIIIDDKGKTISDKEWNITRNYTATLLIVTY